MRMPLSRVLAEDHRLAVLEEEHAVGAHFLGGELLEGAVVEDVAVLVDLDEGGAVVLRGALQRRHQVVRVDVQRARDEGGLGAERDAERVQRVVDRAERASDLVRLPSSRRRRVLALGEAVDLGCCSRMICRSTLRRITCRMWLPPMLSASPSPVTTQT